ncbi:MAG: DinB family protein [Actinomycetota bacterium]
MAHVHGVTVVLVVLPQPSDDERELLLAWLQCLREAVLRKAEGLDETQVRWRPDGKLISIAGIVNHLAHLEWRWIDGALHGQAVSRSEGEFVVPTERPFADVAATYRERADRTDQIVRAADLADPCDHPKHPGITLRWVLLHLIEETARHAGHADATRELLDGRTGV